MEEYEKTVQFDETILLQGKRVEISSKSGSESSSRFKDIKDLTWEEKSDLAKIVAEVAKEQKRIEVEEKRLEEERLSEEKRIKDEENRRVAEKRRLEEERLAEEKKLEEERLSEEGRLWREEIRLQNERIKLEKKKRRKIIGRRVALAVVVVVAVFLGYILVNNYLKEKQMAENYKRILPELKENMVLVEGGTFTMGGTSEQGSGAGSDEKPAHEVTVSSFYMAKYEITQEQWESVIGSNPSDFKGAKRPVENVSWYDVVEFCNKLSEKEGLTPCYTINKQNKDPNNEDKYDEKKWTVTCNFKANGYRLPTEAEWEYAARGGNKSKGYKYSGSDNIDEVGWYEGNSNSQTHEVGTKLPNELGLYDMSGNVMEWCWDWYGDYNSGSQTNPTGPSVGSYRGLRGGSWFDNSEYCRVANRFNLNPFLWDFDSGFRLLRTIL
jgi:formylglycine-generating enzyme required for sulfatase activity